MDRVVLEQMLGEGLSLAEIGRRVGRHEATVSYWLRQYGLKAVNAGRHAPKGSLSRADLMSLVSQGMSTTQIAATVGRSQTTVRHWLREYGLKTIWAERRDASAAGREEMTLDCSRHGVTVFSTQNEPGLPVRQMRC